MIALTLVAVLGTLSVIAGLIWWNLTRRDRVNRIRRSELKRARALVQNQGSTLDELFRLALELRDLEPTLSWRIISGVNDLRDKERKGNS